MFQKAIFGFIATLFLCVFPVFGQEPTENQGISVNKTVGLELPADQVVGNDEGFINIKAKCTGSVRWLVICQIKVKYITNDADNSIIISIPPQGGTISIFAIGLVDGKQTEFVRTNIQIGAAPGPNPNPGPQPGNVAAPLHVTFLVDLNNSTPEIAQLMNSQTLRKFITDKGAYFRFYDFKSPIVTQKKLDQVIASIGGNSAMIVQGNDGKIIAAMPIPKSEQEITGIINKIVGSK